MGCFGRTSFQLAKGHETSQPRAEVAEGNRGGRWAGEHTPWVRRQESASPERAAQIVAPFQGWAFSYRETQGVALGWLVSAPLVLPPFPGQSA